MSTYDFARALGYNGKPSSLDNQIRRLESSNRPIPEAKARLIYMFKKHGVPDVFLKHGKLSCPL